MGTENSVYIQSPIQGVRDYASGSVVMRFAWPPASVAGGRKLGPSSSISMHRHNGWLTGHQDVDIYIPPRSMPGQGGVRRTSRNPLVLQRPSRCAMRGEPYIYIYIHIYGPYEYSRIYSALYTLIYIYIQTPVHKALCIYTYIQRGPIYIYIEAPYIQSLL